MEGELLPRVVVLVTALNDRLTSQDAKRFEGNFV
jgi:hypothetical protein